jgi:predicted nucleic acid-binding protein
VSLVFDTGPILAILDADDPAHTGCVDLLEEFQEPLIVVAATLVEIDYWIRQRLQPEVWSTFVSDIAEGAYRLEQLSVGEMSRVVELQADYRDLDLGMVDAAVMVTCEKLNERKVATLDRRHFGAVRPRHAKHFEILPR